MFERETRRSGIVTTLVCLCEAGRKKRTFSTFEALREKKGSAEIGLLAAWDKNDLQYQRRKPGSKPKSASDRGSSAYFSASLEVFTKGGKLE